MSAVAALVTAKVAPGREEREERDVRDVREGGAEAPADGREDRGAGAGRGSPERRRYARGAAGSPVRASVSAGACGGMAGPRLP
ncbi:chromosome 21 SCAF14577, whole genome shotgun sequence [Streptomyces laurentii]|uniref:Chromosome 21 SCAF14577, whole genome shotgun sequence n=1 Tax=Streptomyces laurentii TaxID=39478 RepID=A0A160NZX2_STRLU|nr:chromosome 21 SCAF14577, whole genome shotgun sequence [Streptomyces laurentii]